LVNSGIICVAESYQNVRFLFHHSLLCNLGSLRWIGRDHEAFCLCGFASALCIRKSSNEMDGLETQEETSERHNRLPKVPQGV